MTSSLKIRILPDAMSVCRLFDFSEVDLDDDLLFLARTPQEYSLVCRSGKVPAKTDAREDDWRIMGIEGILDFSLVGILAGISSLLAEEGISIFAVSTYNTDYILIKEENLEQAEKALKRAGYDVVH